MKEKRGLEQRALNSKSKIEMFTPQSSITLFQQLLPALSKYMSDEYHDRVSLSIRVYYSGEDCMERFL